MVSQPNRLLQLSTTMSLNNKMTLTLTGLHSVTDQKCVFHFRLKPNIWPEKHLALGRIPKPNVQIYIKIGGLLQ